MCALPCACGGDRGNLLLLSLCLSDFGNCKQDASTAARGHALLCPLLTLKKSPKLLLLLTFDISSFSFSHVFADDTAVTDNLWSRQRPTGRREEMEGAKRCCELLEVQSLVKTAYIFGAPAVVGANQWLSKSCPMVQPIAFACIQYIQHAS